MRQKLESRTEAGKMEDDKESKEVKKENLGFRRETLTLRFVMQSKVTLLISLSTER